MAGSKWAGALHDPDAKVRKKAAFTLGNIGPSDASVLPALLGALTDSDAGVRKEAIAALVKYGPQAKDAIPILTEMEKQDPSPEVRTSAGKALQRLRTLEK